MVRRFKKAQYMLKQSLRAWYHHIDLFFINEGFCRSQADHSLYIKQTGETDVEESFIFVAQILITQMAM